MKRRQLSFGSYGVFLLTMAIYSLACDSTIPSTSDEQEKILKVGQQAEPLHPPKGEPAQWSISPEERRKLQAPFEFSPFEICPPPGVNYVTYDEANFSHVWFGPDRPIGMSTHFTVSLVKLSAEEASKPVEELQKQFMKAMQSRHKRWKEEPAQFGMIDGVKFRRAVWVGVTRSGHEMSGVLYSAIHNQQMIQIMCRDLTKENPDVINLGDSAARTFRTLPATGEQK